MTLRVDPALMFAALVLFELTASDMAKLEVRQINTATLFIQYESGVGRVVPLQRYGPWELGWTEGSPVLAYRVITEEKE